MLDVLGREGAVMTLKGTPAPARLEAAVRASPVEWEAWELAAPPVICLRQRGVVDEDPTQDHRSLVQSIGAPAWFVYANVAADPYVAITALDARGRVRWRSSGGARRALKRLQKDASLERPPFTVETSPVLDFGSLGWRAASIGRARRWKFLATPPAPPLIRPWTPGHLRELVVVFAGRSEAAERFVLEALKPRRFAIQRAAPTVTLIRVPGAPAPKDLATKLTKKYRFTTLVCALDLKAQRVTWDTGALDLSAGTSMAEAGMAFDWQALLEKSGKTWKMRTVRPDVHVEP
jgi:hypothetical protein